MAKSLLVWCDLCLCTGSKVGAVAGVVVQVDDAQPRPLDLCEPHHALLTSPPPPPPSERRQRDRNRNRVDRKLGPFLCDLAGCNAPPLANLSTLDQHLRRWHSQTLAAYRAAHGEPVPMTPEQVATHVVEAVCPVQGCGKTYSTATGNRWPHTALTSHLRGVHALRPDGITPVAP